MKNQFRFFGSWKSSRCAKLNTTKARRTQNRADERKNKKDKKEKTL